MSSPTRWSAQLAPRIAELNKKLPAGLSDRHGRLAGREPQVAALGRGGPAADAAADDDHPDDPVAQLQPLFLVLSVAPLGLIGVVAAMLLSGKPFGFVALLGVVALVGMIVRNSVVLVVQIDEEIAEGKHPWDSVLEATMNRTRPILLTAAAAILGMIPIAPTVFWGPMAYAIMGGLAGATVLTLVFLPALYVVWFRVKEPAAPAKEKS